MIIFNYFLNYRGPQFLKFGSLTISVLAIIAATCKQVCLPVPDFPKSEIESG
jgi:hypothetical protein